VRLAARFRRLNMANLRFIMYPGGPPDREVRESYFEAEIPIKRG
jgi:hypothetical protein